MCRVVLLAFWATVVVAHAGVRYTVLIEREGEIADNNVGQVTLWPAGDAAASGWAVRDAASGAAVAHHAVWQRPGEPVQLCFDASSRSARYVVDALDTPGVATQWLPRAGLVVETRRLPLATSATADTWEEALALWQHAGAPVGRSFTERVFSGLPPHELATDFIVRFQGWLQIDQAGEYALATVSDDASFLALDGRRIAAWPGQHGPEGGVFGTHHGLITLEKGVYSFDYLNVQFGAGYRVVAAWRRPGEKAFEVIPATAFVPIDTFVVRTVAAPTTVAPVFAWANERFAVIGPTVLYDVRLWLPGGVKGDEVRWTFDDGLTALGDSVRHVFVGERTAEVVCEVWRDGSRTGRIVQRVRLLRNPAQREEAPDSLVGALLQAASYPQALRRRAVAELYPLFLAADAVGHAQLAVIAEILFERRNACVGALAEGPYALGFYYQRPGWRDHDRVEATWAAVLDDPQAPPALRAQTGLHLAGFLLHSGRDVARGMKLLDTVATDDALGDGDRRLKLIFSGDGRLMLGDRVGAIEMLRRAGREIAENDTHYEVRRRVRLEAARHYLAKKEHAAAERAIRELEWEWPLERLNLETGLLMMEVYRDRGELDFALAAGRRLLVGAPADPARSDLLLALADVQRELKQEEAFMETLRHLRREYPYSEAAARAADRYPTNG